MNKHNESRPFLDELEKDIAGGMPATKIYQMVLEYLDERDRERNELAAQVERLRGALDLMCDRAAQVDGWESFPSKWIDEALEVYAELPAQSLEAVKREWKERFIDDARKNAEYGLGDSLSIPIDELKEL